MYHNSVIFYFPYREGNFVKTSYHGVSFIYNVLSMCYALLVGRRHGMTSLQSYLRILKGFIFCTPLFSFNVLSIHYNLLIARRHGVMSLQNYS